MGGEAEGGRRRRTLLWVGLAVLGSLVLEVGRELLVLNTSAPTYVIGPPFSLTATDAVAKATGMWERSGIGAEMIQGTVEILCVKDWRACVVFNNFYNPSSPALATRVDVGRLIEFNASAVTFKDINTACNETTVRMDLVQRRVVATRERKPEGSGEECADYEARVAVELVDARQFDRRSDIRWTYEHFLPIYHAVIPALRSDRSESSR